MTPHRSVYHSPSPRHIPQILAASGCALLFLSGVSGLASLLGWLVAGLILAGMVAVGLLALACWAIAARDIALELPGALE
jgi:hypothetical protein